MKWTFLLPLLFLLSCNNNGKDSVEEADSMNQAKRDSAGKNTGIIVDETSSSFLVHAANDAMAGAEITFIAQQKAVYQPVKDLAVMLYHDHSTLNNNIKSLAAQKNIVLPDSISTGKRNDIDDLQKKAGKNFDKIFIEMMIRNNQASIDLFEQNRAATGDADISAFADKTLPALRAQLDLAKALQKKYWQ